MKLFTVVEIMEGKKSDRHLWLHISVHINGRKHTFANLYPFIQTQFSLQFSQNSKSNMWCWASHAKTTASSWHWTKKCKCMLSSVESQKGVITHTQIINVNFVILSLLKIHLILSHFYFVFMIRKSKKCCKFCQLLFWARRTLQCMYM